MVPTTVWSMATIMTTLDRPSIAYSDYRNERAGVSEAGWRGMPPRGVTLINAQPRCSAAFRAT